MIGGPQGSGVETAANIFSQVYSKMGYHVFGKREYYSNIKGEHSYFAVRISDRKFVQVLMVPTFWLRLMQKLYSDMLMMF